MKIIVILLLSFLFSSSFANGLNNWKSERENISQLVDAGNKGEAWCTAWPYLQTDDPDALLDTSLAVMYGFIYPPNFSQDTLNHLRLTLTLSMQSLSEGEGLAANPDDKVTLLEFVVSLLGSNIFRADAAQTLACFDNDNADFKHCIAEAEKAQLIPTWESFKGEFNEYCP